MFGDKRKNAPPPIVGEVASKLEAMKEPVRSRYLVERMRAERQRKETELRQLELTVQTMAREIRILQQEEAWLQTNPEFDAIYARLSEKPVDPKST
jgi:hypothetical protein